MCRIWYIKTFKLSLDVCAIKSCVAIAWVPLVIFEKGDFDDQKNETKSSEQCVDWLSGSHLSRNVWQPGSKSSFSGSFSIRIFNGRFEFLFHISISVGGFLKISSFGIHKNYTKIRNHCLVISISDSPEKPYNLHKSVLSCSR